MRSPEPLLLALALSLGAITARAQTPANHRPVAVVAEPRLTVTASGGRGTLPVFLSADWTHPLPNTTRAIVIVHGYLRNADRYMRTGEAAVAAGGTAASGTIVIAPQFLADVDASAHHLPRSVLHWTTGSWESGANALGPAPISSFAALDTIIARLADRTLFPHLREIVIAGHSGGAQVVQRYAILAPSPPPGIAVRYVVANPSSYAYFDATRPAGVNSVTCPRFDTWKYGMHRLPPYAAGASPGFLEQRYAGRDVIELLGTADIDPHHPALDTSCMGEAQGPFRLARGLAYARYLRARNGETDRQHVFLVPGVAHDAQRMFTSACGLAALFGAPGTDRPDCAPASR